MKPAGASRKKKDTPRGATISPPDAVRAPKPRGPLALALLALAALTGAAFSNSFDSGFILDNRGLLLDPRIRHATADNVALIFAHSYWWPNGEAGLYRPFTTLSYLFNYAVLGDASDPLGYHWVNLLMHLGNVFLAFAIARRLLRDLWPSFFVAALWAVHPVLTESVTNIVGRADLLAGMGVLAGFLLYLKSSEAHGQARACWLTGLALVTAIGVFSKESAVAIVPVVIVYELLWPSARRWRALLWAGVAMVMPIAVMLYQRVTVLAASAPAEFPYTDNPITRAGWWTGRLTALKVMAEYLCQTIWPANLSCDYSYNQIPLARGSAGDWLAWGALLAAIAAMALASRFERRFLFLSCFAFFNFLPASNLLFATGTIRADRLLYLPSLGLLGCAVIVVYAALRRPRLAWAAPAFLSLAVVGFAGRTWLRNRNWQNELAIATDLRVSPNSFKLHRLLASALFDSDPSRADLPQVIAEQEKSLEILASAPPDARPFEPYRMAGYYDLLESRLHPSPELYRKAIAALEESLSLPHRAPDAQAYLLLSVAYLESGDSAKALPPARQACAADPLNPQVYRQLSDVFLDLNRRAEAQAARNLEDAASAARNGDWQRTLDLASSADAALYPASRYFSAIANLRLGNLKAAEQQGREAVRLDQERRNPAAGYVLGLILAKEREFGEAATLLRGYLDASPDAPDADQARQQLHEIENQAAR